MFLRLMFSGFIVSKREKLCRAEGSSEKESQSSMLWQLFMILHSKNNGAIRKVTFMNVIAAGIFFALFFTLQLSLMLVIKRDG
ncbi:hypothetical protein AUS15_25740 [Escherichia coli]|nr:hypothetical protein AUS15_25740 [Escherichia coli]